MRLVEAVAVLAIAAIFGCTGGERPPSPGQASAPTTAALGGTVVARVGDIPIERSLVAAVARAQRVGADVALQRLIDDVLLSEVAKKEGAANDLAVRGAERSALGRALLLRLRGGALAKGPFTDAEIAAQLPGYWLELDRPERRLIVHALVKKDVPNGAEVARALQKELVTANGPDAARSEAEFTARAKAFQATPPVHVEKFAIVSDGRVAAANAGSVLESFTKGTFDIPEVLGTSDVVETTYGWHVIRLLEKFPPLHTTREEKIAKMMPDLVAVRVRALQDELVTKLHASAKTEIVANDSDLLLPR